MKFHRYVVLCFCIIFIVSITGCSVVGAFNPAPTMTATPISTNTAVPPTPTATPTATLPLFFLDAIVYSGNIQVPILIYHHFVPDFKTSNATETRYADFKDQLQAFYDHGFSLISLKDWLNGSFLVPEGRKPLILTMDDFWFADQLFIEDDGTPSIYSGVGILWQFSKDNPDFGFSVSVFSNMGDKFYANLHDKSYFIIGEDDAWKNKLGQTIAWAIENNVDPYNHTWKHPQLAKMADEDIQTQLVQNDLDTRYFLTRVGRSDLIPRLGNIIALPFGEWPATFSGVNVIKNYKDPEGVPVSAIMEAYNLDSAQLTKSVFSDGFDRFKTARITASNYMTQYIINHRDEVPSAGVCQLGPLKRKQASDLDLIKTLIESAVTNQGCPEGVYNVNGNVFVAKNGGVTLFLAKQPAADQPSLTPTATRTP